MFSKQTLIIIKQCRFTNSRTTLMLNASEPQFQLQELWWLHSSHQCPTTPHSSYRPRASSYRPTGQPESQLPMCQVQLWHTFGDSVLCHNPTLWPLQTQGQSTSPPDLESTYGLPPQCSVGILVCSTAIKASLFLYCLLYIDSLVQGLRKSSPVGPVQKKKRSAGYCPIVQWGVVIT